MKSSRCFSWRKTVTCNIFWMFTFSLQFSNEFFVCHLFRVWLKFFWVVRLFLCFFLSSIHFRSIQFSSFFFFHCELSVLAILITLASLNFYREDWKNIVKYNDLNRKSNKMTQNSIDLKHLQTTKKKMKIFMYTCFFMA